VLTRFRVRVKKWVEPIQALMVPNGCSTVCRRTLRLSPHERMGAPLVVMGQAYFFKRQFDAAASKLLLSIQDHPGSPPAYRTLAACHAHMGRLVFLAAMSSALTLSTLRERAPGLAPCRTSAFDPLVCLGVMPSAFNF
jgi:hypothetical protein